MSGKLPPLRPLLKFGYGLGELGPAMAGSTMIFFQLVFLTNVAGLHASLAGSVLMIGKVWDAVNDPVIGWLSDKTRSRWGRRLPWIVIGAFPVSFFFVLGWMVPGFASGDSQWALFGYYAAVVLVYNTFYTAVTLSHSALTPEFSEDYDERSRLTSWRMGSSLAGSVGGLLIALIVFQLLSNSTDQVRYLVMAITIAILSLLAIAVCVWSIRGVACEAESLRRDREQAQSDIGQSPGHLPIKTQLALIGANRPFLIVCGIYLFSWLALQFTAAILPYFVVSWLGMAQTQFQMIALAVQVTALVFIPVWGWLCVKWGKKAVYFVGMSFWLVAQTGMIFLTPDFSSWVYVMAITAGLGVSVCYLVPNAMLPDVMELDELETGERREGVFYGFFVFLQKMALALGAFIVGQVLGLAGYIASGPGETPPIQPDSALFAIRIAIGPLPALAIVLGMVCAAIYPISRTRHAEILRQLALRRG